MRPTGNLLFTSPIDALGGNPLFKGTSDLAGALVKGESSRVNRGKEVKRLATYLSQVLVYDDPRRSRPLSDTLRDQVFEAVRNRLREVPVDEEAIEDWLRRMQNAIELDAVSRAAPSPLNAEQLFYEVVDLTQTAAEQFIITSQPAELVTSLRARTLNEILLNRLGLDQLAEGGSPGAPRAKYVFNFPTASVGKRFWRSLTRGVARQVPEGAAAVDQEKVRAALQNLVDSKHLVVQEIPAYMCACPTVVFEPDENRAIGFNLYYHSYLGDQPLVSIAKLDRNSLEFWRNNFHLVIIEEHVQVTPIAIPALE